MKEEFKRIINIISRPYMRILPGNLAFSFMMALIPILSLIVSICGLFHYSPVLVDKIDKIIPGAVLDTILMYINGNGFSSILLAIIGIWSASGGMNSLIIASNIVFDHKKDNYLRRRIKSLSLVLLIVVIIIVTLGFLVFGDALLKLILAFFELPSSILELFIYLKWPIALVLIFTIVKIIYIVAPDTNLKGKYVNKGALYTTILWLLSSALYSFYVSNIANYTVKYGSLANIIILLIWLYIMSYILVLGTAINVNEYDKGTSNK